MPHDTASPGRTRITKDTGSASVVYHWLLDAGLSSRAIHLYALLDRYSDWDVSEAEVTRKALAEKLSVSVKTLDRTVKELVAAGALEVHAQHDEHGDQRANRYHLLSVNRGGVTSGEGGGVTTDEAKTQMELPDKSFSSSSARTSFSRDGWLPKSVGGRAVSSQEREWVDSLLDLFNEQSGKRFSGKSWRESIVRRLREHPDVGLDEHKALVVEQFQRPWWKGEPSPGVIWGNDRVFDRALNRTQGPQPERTTGYTLPEDHPRAFTVRRR